MVSRGHRKHSTDRADHPRQWRNVFFMKSPTTIVRVDHQKVFVPFHQAAEWAAGKRPGTMRLIVQVHTADGTIGLGETICLWEFVEPVLARTMAPLVLGEDACDVERICKKLEGAGY